MKYFFATILAFLSTIAIGQPVFEGIIRYQMTVKKDSAALVDMTAYFKKDKIKIVTTVRETSEGMDLKNETIILNFKEATIDRIKEEGKTIERERMSLQQKKQDIPDLSSLRQNSITILNHPCTEFSTGLFSKDEIKDSVIVTSKGEIKIFYASDLIFPVPDSLKMIQMVPLFTNGNIALRTEIKIEQAPVIVTLSCEAKEIQPAKKGLPASVFRYPKGYSLKFNE
jgi:hypothetical protein